MSVLEHEKGAAAGCIAALNFGRVSFVDRVRDGPTVLVDEKSGSRVEGEEEIIRHVARTHAHALLGVGVEAARVEETCALQLRGDALERALLLRTFLAGHQISIADLIALGPSTAASGPNTKRWRSLVLAKCGVASDQPKADAGPAVNLGSQGSFAKVSLFFLEKKSYVLSVTDGAHRCRGGASGCPLPSGALRLSPHWPWKGGIAERLLSHFLQRQDDCALRRHQSAQGSLVGPCVWSV